MAPWCLKAAVSPVTHGQTGSKTAQGNNSGHKSQPASLKNAIGQLCQDRVLKPAVSALPVRQCGDSPIPLWQSRVTATPRLGLLGHDTFFGSHCGGEKPLSWPENHHRLAVCQPQVLVGPLHLSQKKLSAYLRWDIPHSFASHYPLPFSGAVLGDRLGSHLLPQGCQHLPQTFLPTCLAAQSHGRVLQALLALNGCCQCPSGADLCPQGMFTCLSSICIHGLCLVQDA